MVINFATVLWRNRIERLWIQEKCFSEWVVIMLCFGYPSGLGWEITEHESIAKLK